MKKSILFLTCFTIVSNAYGNSQHLKDQCDPLDNLRNVTVSAQNSSSSMKNNTSWYEPAAEYMQKGLTFVIIAAAAKYFLGQDDNQQDNNQPKNPRKMVNDVLQEQAEKIKENKPDLGSNVNDKVCHFQKTRTLSSVNEHGVTTLDALSARIKSLENLIEKTESYTQKNRI